MQAGCLRDWQGVHVRPQCNHFARARSALNGRNDSAADNSGRNRIDPEFAQAIQNEG